MEELNQRKSEELPGMSKEMKNMYEILKRMESVSTNASTISDFDITDDIEDIESQNGDEEIDSDDEQEVDDLEKRLVGINFDDADAVWDKLTDEEKQGFESLIHNGDVTSLIPIFEPWWNHKEVKKLVEIVELKEGEEIVSEESFKNNCPRVLENITDFNKISSKSPASVVQNNLINVLSAYVCTVRFFNGDHKYYPQESSHYLKEICANLKSNSNFETKDLAMETVCYDSKQNGLLTDENIIEYIREDVEKILQGPFGDGLCNFYILSALSDVHEMFTLAKEGRSDSCKKVGVFSKRFADHEINSFENVKKSKLNIYLKKLEYYLSFASSFC